MIRNYFTAAVRNLTKNRMVSIIHILGLTIGVAVCLLIYQYVSFERSFDSFHERVEDIYRVPIEYSEGFGNWPKTAANHPGFGPAAVAEFPEVESYTRILHPSSMGSTVALALKQENGPWKSFVEEHLYIADSTFFEMFSFPVKHGSTKNALDGPYKIVLTESLARKYFGDIDPVGRTMNLGSSSGSPLIVTAVIRDVPANSHLQFSSLISFSTYFKSIGSESLWVWPEFYTYLMLKPGSDPTRTEAKFPAFAERHLAEIHKEYGFQTYFSLQPLVDIHLKSECANEPTPQGSERTVYFLSLLGIFIIVIALVNYVNLATSKSLDRAKEVGVRKTIGARRSQLMFQFLLEATLLVGVGLFTGAVLANALLPTFSQIVGTNIGLPIINTDSFSNPQFYLLITLAIFVGGLVAGFYPALVLSGYKPVRVLKGDLKESSNRFSLARILVGFQFMLSTILIAAAVMVSRQLIFMDKKDLGYAKEQILVIRAPHTGDSLALVRGSNLTQELSALPEILSLTRTSEVPGRPIALRGEARRDGQGSDLNVTDFMYRVDHKFISTFDIPMKAGRNFVESDSSRIFNAPNNKVVINEELASSLGFSDPMEAVGQQMKFKMGLPFHDAEIIGVTANHHQRSPRESFEPILYYYPSWDNWRFFSMRISSQDWEGVLSRIEQAYHKFFEGSAFDFFFLDEFFDRQYRSDQRFSRICILLAALAVFISCLGFFGLSILILNQRTKEIGVRKLLGASTASIMLLLTGRFMRLMLVANIIAIPIVIFFGREWLNDFAFNTGLQWQVFISPVLVLTLIIFLIVGYQVFKTTTLDPIHALRDE